MSYYTLDRGYTKKLKTTMKQQIKFVIAVVIAVMMVVPTMAAKKKTTTPEPDRKVWADLCYKISRPVLENMSKGNFQKDFVL